MNSRTTERFRLLLSQLPSDVRRRTQEAYRRFRGNPDLPGLRFKRVHTRLPVYSVRITRDYRALGVIEGSDIIWFWIGKHEDYERMLATFD